MPSFFAASLLVIPRCNCRDAISRNFLLQLIAGRPECIPFWRAFCIPIHCFSLRIFSSTKALSLAYIKHMKGPSMSLSISSLGSRSKHIFAVDNVFDNSKYVSIFIWVLLSLRSYLNIDVRSCTSHWYKDIELTPLHRPDLILPSMYRSLVGSFETVHILHGIRRHGVSAPVYPCYWRYPSWYPRSFQ